MPKTDAIVNARVITPFRIIDNAGIVIKDGIIADVILNGDYSTVRGMNIFDAEGMYLSPGFIDMHNHGGGGHDYMEGTVEAVLQSSYTHLLHGTTSIVPTTSASPDKDLFKMMDSFIEAKEVAIDAPRLLGMHLEGPYFSMEQRGAQNSEYLKNPVRKEYLKILDYAKGNILIWSAAPELQGGMELGQELRTRGIIASIGHSDAYYSEVVKAFESGYSQVTHLYSGCSLLRRKNSYRYLGVVESAFLINGLNVEVIADGCHMPIELLQMIYKIKGADKIILITDSCMAAGMPEGEYLIGNQESGRKIIVEDGVAKLPDRSSFAGSVATADRLIRTMYKGAGLPLHEVVGMMTANPARVLGKSGSLGVIAVGANADLVVFDEDIRISKVFVGGEEITV